MSTDRNFSPVAVWYSLPSGGDDGSNAALDGTAGDFATMSDLGFNTVLLDGAAERDRQILDDLADKHGLHILRPDPDAEAYVSSGRLPLECWWPWALAWHTQRRGVEIVSFGAVTDLESGVRARTLADLHHKRDWAPATFAVIAPDSGVFPAGVPVTFCGHTPRGNPAPVEGGTTGVRGNLAEISAIQPTGSHDAACAEWLAGFHRALASGQTSGVVFDRFRATGAGWVGIVDERGTVPSRRASAIKRITKRASKWLPRLRRAAARRLDVAAASHLPLEVVLFTAGRRQFLMVLNASPDRFVREPIGLSAQFDGRLANRLVAVPIDDTSAVGEVLPVRRSRVTVPVDLGPGDARLYEVF